MQTLSVAELLPYQFLRNLVPIFIDENGCWFHKSRVDTHEYQRYKVNKNSILLHRLSARMFLGLETYSKLFVCHKCNTLACFNPEHLYLGTPKDNADDKKLDKNTLMNKTSNLEELNEKFDSSNYDWSKIEM